jgi:hypothetical protein
MADIYITEYAALARDAHNYHIAAGREPSIAEQKIAATGTTAQSNALNALTAFVMVHATAAAHLAFGTNPTAVVTAHRIGAGETRFYGVPVGQSFKIAAINGA